MNESIAIHRVAQDQNRRRRRGSSDPTKEGDWIEVRRLRVRWKGRWGRLGADEAVFSRVGGEGGGWRRNFRSVRELPESWEVSGKGRAGF